MAKRFSGLGRGLDAILSDVEKAYEKNISRSENIIELDISKIRPNPFQPRKVFSDSSLKELSESILEHGLLQPIIVYRDGDDYALIAGERRLRASKIAGKEKIRAIIAEVDMAKLHELALIENIQREELNPIDLAKAYQKLIEDYKITHEELALRVKKSRPQITNTLRLLGLIPAVQEALIDERITQGHAKVLIGLDKNTQEVIMDSIIGQRLSVAEVEKLVRSFKTKASNVTNIINNTKENIPELKHILTQLHACGLNAKAKSNQIVITLQNSKEAQDLLLILKK